MKKILNIIAVGCLMTACNTMSTTSENQYVSDFVKNNVSENCAFMTSNGFYSEYKDTTTNAVYAVSVGRDGRITSKQKNVWERGR